MKKSVPIKTSDGYDFKCSGIKFCWEMNLEDYERDNLKQNVLPAIYIDLIFPIQNNLFIKSDNHKINRPFISPILHQRKEIIFNRGSRIFGIRISPILACGIMKAPLSVLEQRANRLEDVCPQPMYNKLVSIIYSECDFFKKVDFIDRILLKANNFIKLDYKLLSNCINQISHFTDCSVGGLAQTTGYSTRWLEKSILNNFGITPIQLISITRLNRFIELLVINPYGKLTSLAVDAGYYDQSHLIRDLKKYTGKTPKDFKRTLDTFRKTMNHL